MLGWGWCGYNATVLHDKKCLYVYITLHTFPEARGIAIPLCVNIRPYHATPRSFFLFNNCFFSLSTNQNPVFGRNAPTSPVCSVIYANLTCMFWESCPIPVQHSCWIMTFHNCDFSVSEFMQWRHASAVHEGDGSQICLNGKVSQVAKSQELRKVRALFKPPCQLLISTRSTSQKNMNENNQ